MGAGGPGACWRQGARGLCGGMVAGWCLQPHTRQCLFGCRHCSFLVAGFGQHSCIWLQEPCHAASGCCAA
eukprot:3115734-Prorocentrum_lima.AAC.1